MTHYVRNILPYTKSKMNSSNGSTYRKPLNEVVRKSEYFVLISLQKVTLTKNLKTDSSLRFHEVMDIFDTPSQRRISVRNVLRSFPVSGELEMSKSNILSKDFYRHLYSYVFFYDYLRDYTSITNPLFRVHFTVVSGL